MVDVVVVAIVDDVVVAGSVGLLLGDEVGTPVGEPVSAMGAAVGFRVGPEVGDIVKAVHGPFWQHFPQYASLVPQ